MEFTLFCVLLLLIGSSAHLSLCKFFYAHSNVFMHLCPCSSLFLRIWSFFCTRELFYASKLYVFLRDCYLIFAHFGCFLRFQIILRIWIFLNTIKGWREYIQLPDKVLLTRVSEDEWLHAVMNVRVQFSVERGQAGRTSYVRVWQVLYKTDMLWNDGPAERDRCSE